MDWSSKVFYGNICFICHATAKDVALKKCGSCKLVSYCSTVHQRRHWKRHSRFCKLIKSIEAMWKPENVQEPMNWYKYRTNLLLLCELKLGSKLDPCEVNMILFPNNCEVCHKLTSTLFCPNCLCVNYCSEEHKQADFARHRTMCPSFALCFQLDLEMGKALYYPVYQIRRCHFNLTEDIDNFMAANVHLEHHGLTPVQERALISELITCPLTLLYGISLTNFRLPDNLVVHVIGSSFLETASLEAWKIILHVQPTIRSVCITFIGPEVCPNTARHLCSSCKDKMSFQFFSLCYHDYIQTRNYVEPHIICSFNCGFHEFEDTEVDTWKESLPYLTKNSNVPLIFTSFTEREAREDSAMLLKTGRRIRMRIAKNPFASSRPYRDLESGGIYFNNQYVGVMYHDIM